MGDIEALTRPQLLALFARSTDAKERRAIQRRLQQLEEDQPPPAPALRKAPPMHEPEYRVSLRRLLPPTTRPWWSLEQIAETLDRANGEWNERKGERP